jgi:hypothetical protein
MSIAKRAREAGYRGPLPMTGWKSSADWDREIRMRAEAASGAAERSRSLREDLAVRPSQMALFGDES